MKTSETGFNKSIKQGDSEIIAAALRYYSTSKMDELGKYKNRTSCMPVGKLAAVVSFCRRPRLIARNPDLNHMVNIQEIPCTVTKLDIRYIPSLTSNVFELLPESKDNLYG